MDEHDGHEGEDCADDHNGELYRLVEDDGVDGESARCEGEGERELDDEGCEARMSTAPPRRRARAATVSIGALDACRLAHAGAAALVAL